MGINFPKHGKTNQFKGADINRKTNTEMFEELGSSLGAVNQINRFIPNLAQLCHEIRPLLKKDLEMGTATDQHDKAFQKINEKVKQVVEVGHFKRSCPDRIV